VDLESETMLFCRAGERVCALPIFFVVETLRPLPVETWPNAPSILIGVSMIRSMSVPVLHLSRILGVPGTSDFTSSPSGERWITVRSQQRLFALAVDAVHGVRTVAKEGLLPLPLQGEQVTAGALDAVAVNDAALFFVLSATQLVPDSIWAELQQRMPAT